MNKNFIVTDDSATAVELAKVFNQIQTCSDLFFFLNDSTIKFDKCNFDANKIHYTNRICL